jgi:mono/diheme cytochrome c family protein
VVFEQNAAMRPWSQFDGSIGDHVTRSLIAARTSGSSVEALSKPEIEHNVRAAADYTLNLGSGPEVKTYAQLFPEAQYRIDPVRAERGFAVYQASCNACHGYRPLGGGGWSLAGADKIHQISSLAAIGTDPYRIEFRYSAMLPLAINAQFPGPPAVRSGDLPARSQQDARLDEAQQAALAARRGSEAAWWKAYHAQFSHAARLYPAGHPFAFPFAKVRQTPGFINNPIPFAYLRAPYLHNASVSTLAQLINLEPRAPVFCRGNNAYDPLSVGLVAPAPPADAPCPPLLPFRFDAGAPGNSNAGHDFPWAWNDPARDPERLRDLLEYLKTL